MARVAVIGGGGSAVVVHVVMVIVVWWWLLLLLLLLPLVSLEFVLPTSFALHTHNGISVYHTSDKVIYSTAIGFFANINENNNNTVIEQRGGGRGHSGLRYEKTMT